MNWKHCCFVERGKRSAICRQGKLWMFSCRVSNNPQGCGVEGGGGVALTPTFNNAPHPRHFSNENSVKKRGKMFLLYQVEKHMRLHCACMNTQSSDMPSRFCICIHIFKQKLCKVLIKGTTWKLGFQLEQLSHHVIFLTFIVLSESN